ncbi:MAG TPA: hypothetical protein VIM30_00050 [Candidatus Limnocylindrales bacterium]
MRRQEDRDAALAQLFDQLVDIARGDRVKPGCRLVEEQHLRVAEQRPRQRDALAETLGQGAAGIAGPVGQVDGTQGKLDATARVGDFVQVGETLEVLDHAQAEIEARRLGHDRDPPADFHAVVGRERDSGDCGRARGRCHEGAECPHRRRLASAIGAEKPEDLTMSYLKGHIVERDAVAESLRQVADR